MFNRQNYELWVKEIKKQKEVKSMRGVMEDAVHAKNLKWSLKSKPVQLQKNKTKR